MLLDINPTLTTAGYPTAWTQYNVTISGLSGPTSGRLAFRYFVTGAGPSGSNSDYIGIDDVLYTSTGVSYAWSNGASYSVTVTDATACTGTAPPT
ncbi:MAG: choice-of-anchor J domain-containing protein [Bacteroidetes bacterium]|nr:choice-of-anchor J domain-containing protein [Bacteroidota bacterium]